MEFRVVGSLQSTLDVAPTKTCSSRRRNFSSRRVHDVEEGRTSAGKREGPLGIRQRLAFLRLLLAQRSASRWKNITLDVDADTDRFTCEYHQEKFSGAWTKGLRRARASGTSGTRAVFTCGCAGLLSKWSALRTGV